MLAAQQAQVALEVAEIGDGGSGLVEEVEVGLPRPMVTVLQGHVVEQIAEAPQRPVVVRVGEGGERRLAEAFVALEGFRVKVRCIRSFDPNRSPSSAGDLRAEWDAGRDDREFWRVLAGGDESCRDVSRLSLEEHSAL